MKPTVVFKGKTDQGLDILIRYPTLEDLEVMFTYINTLSKEQTYIRYQGEEITFEQESRYLAKQLEKINKNQAVQLLAFNTNQLIGISDILMKDRVENHIGIFGITVAKEFRGKGIGKVLMERVLEEGLRKLSQLKIATLEVFANNHRAIQLYQKFGFKQYGLLPKGIKHKNNLIDAILMYKTIRD